VIKTQVTTENRSHQKARRAIPTDIANPPRVAAERKGKGNGLRKLPNDAGNAANHPRLGRSAQARAMAAGNARPLGWLFLSMATPYRFVGGAIVQARGLQTAIARMKELGIYPGDTVDDGDEVEILLTPLTKWDMKKRIPARLRDRILTDIEVLTELEGRGV
jgi:hypothetical protein